MSSARREPCKWCGGEAIEGATCPKSLACPRCGAESGQSCRRPSGHRADTLHAARVEAAEATDRANGVSYGNTGTTGTGEGLWAS